MLEKLRSLRPPGRPLESLKNTTLEGQRFLVCLSFKKGSTLGVGLTDYYGGKGVTIKDVAGDGVLPDWNTSCQSDPSSDKRKVIAGDLLIGIGSGSGSYIPPGVEKKLTKFSEKMDYRDIVAQIRKHIIKAQKQHISELVGGAKDSSIYLQFLRPAHPPPLRQSVSRSRSRISSADGLGSVEQKLLVRFRQVVRDPLQMGNLMKFLSTKQKHEVLFVCDVQQLLDSSSRLDTIALVQTIKKIFKMYLTQESSSGGDEDGRCDVLWNIDDFTQQDIQPFRAALLLPEEEAIDVPRGLELLKTAKFQVEVSLATQYLQKYLDYRDGKTSEKEVDLGIDQSDPDVLVSPYEFDDVLLDTSCFRSYLLFLMDAQRYQMLTFWKECVDAQLESLLLQEPVKSVASPEPVKAFAATTAPKPATGAVLSTPLVGTGTDELGQGTDEQDHGDNPEAGDTGDNCLTVDTDSLAEDLNTALLRLERIYTKYLTGSASPLCFARFVPHPHAFYRSQGVSAARYGARGARDQKHPRRSKRQSMDLPVAHPVGKSAGSKDVGGTHEPTTNPLSQTSSDDSTHNSTPRPVSGEGSTHNRTPRPAPEPPIRPAPAPPAEPDSEQPVLDKISKASTDGADVGEVEGGEAGEGDAKDGVVQQGLDAFLAGENEGDDKEESKAARVLGVDETAEEAALMVEVNKAGLQVKKEMNLFMAQSIQSMGHIKALIKSASKDRSDRRAQRKTKHNLLQSDDEERSEESKILFPTEDGDKGDVNNAAIVGDEADGNKEQGDGEEAEPDEDGEAKLEGDRLQDLQAAVRRKKEDELQQEQQHREQLNPIARYSQGITTREQYLWELAHELHTLTKKIDRILRFDVWSMFIASPHHRTLLQLSREGGHKASPGRRGRLGSIARSLMSYLKQQPITQDMLVMDCMEPRETHEVVACGLPVTPAPHRLLEYYCVLRALPLGGPHQFEVVTRFPEVDHAASEFPPVGHLGQLCFPFHNANDDVCTCPQHRAVPLAQPLCDAWGFPVSPESQELLRHRRRRKCFTFVLQTAAGTRLYGGCLLLRGCLALCLLSSLPLINFLQDALSSLPAPPDLPTEVFRNTASDQPTDTTDNPTHNPEKASVSPSQSHSSLPLPSSPSLSRQSSDGRESSNLPSSSSPVARALPALPSSKELLAWDTSACDFFSSSPDFLAAQAPLLRMLEPTMAADDFFARTQAKLKTPPQDVDLSILFAHLPPHCVLLTLEALLSEQKVLLVSSNLAILGVAAESLRSLLYPFTWNYLFIPLLPLSLFQYLQCPTPLLMGIHSCYVSKARALLDSSALLVDLDNGSLSVDSTLRITRFPSICRSQLMRVARKLYQRKNQLLDCGASSSTAEAPLEADCLLRKEFVKMWAFLLSGWREHCVFLPDHVDPTIIFDCPGFIRARVSTLNATGRLRQQEASELGEFLKILCRSSYFPLFLHQRTDKLAVDGLKSLEEPDPLELYQSVVHCSEDAQLSGGCGSSKLRWHLVAGIDGLTGWHRSRVTTYSQALELINSFNDEEAVQGEDEDDARVDGDDDERPKNTPTNSKKRRSKKRRSKKHKK